MRICALRFLCNELMLLCILKAVPSLVAPTTRMNMPIKIPNETFNLESSLYPDEGITVTFTSTVENKDFVSAHLISTNYLQGQVSFNVVYDINST